MAELKKKVEAQEVFVTTMKERHALSIKLLTMIGGGLLSVVSSLVVWMLTKG